MATKADLTKQFIVDYHDSIVNATKAESNTSITETKKLITNFLNHNEMHNSPNIGAQKENP